MNKNLVFIFLLITQSLSQNNINLDVEPLQKMKKGNGFDDDICAYTYSDITYVKPCKEGKFCKNHDEISKCTEIETKIYPKYLGDQCSSDLECEQDLICSIHCTLSYSCGSNKEPYKTESGSYDCRITSKKNILYEADKTVTVTNYYDMLNLIQNDGTSGTPLYQHLSYFQVIGKITFFPPKSDPILGDLYAIEKVESAYIGTVDDGEFVGDQLACKSGFALYFYPNKALVDPSTNSGNNMYLMCVTLNDVDITNFMVKYNGDKIYNLNKNVQVQKIRKDGHLQTLSNTNMIGAITGSSSYYDISGLLVQNEIFGKYIGVFTPQKQEECEKQKKYYEPRTCEDNEVRKWWYFYNNPGDYVLYYDEEDKDNDITNYLLQTHYRTFISGSFLSAKFLISIIMFLFL